MPSFSKELRLLTSSAFSQVFSEEKKIVSAYFITFYRPNNLQHPRLGMAYSKKNLPAAVARNRLKRVTRESFRLSLVAIPAVDVVILSRKDVKKAASADITKCLEHHWRLLKERCTKYPA